MGATAINPKYYANISDYYEEPWNVNGILIEPGMIVQVVSQSFSNPVVTNGGQPVVDAFMRVYGIDIKKAGALNTVDLQVEKIG